MANDLQIFLQATYRIGNDLVYPINIGRNIARETVNTHFVFASDVELYPSPGLITDFLDMIRQQDQLELHRRNPRVFVNAIFEIDIGHDLPKTKGELLDLLERNIVIPFHSQVCLHCHKLPRFLDWKMDNFTGIEKIINFEPC